MIMFAIIAVYVFTSPFLTGDKSIQKRPKKVYIVNKYIYCALISISEI